MSKNLKIELAGDFGSAGNLATTLVFAVRDDVQDLVHETYERAIRAPGARWETAEGAGPEGVEALDMVFDETDIQKVEVFGDSDPTANAPLFALSLAETEDDVTCTDVDHLRALITLLLSNLDTYST